MALVLIVEDNADHMEIYATFLSNAGHTVIQATTGAAALALVRERCPEIIVMDVSMPGMDGLEATRRLKGDPDTRDIPVLVLTAHALTWDSEDALRAGAHAYLAKPCEPSVVLAEVERLLS